VGLKDNEIKVSIKGKDQASKPINAVEKKVDGLSNKFKLAAAGMMAASAGMIAGMVSAVKAAGEEEAGIARLSVAMRNVGLSYDASREKLEAWIDANQQATSFADSEQRDSLASLIRMTGNLEQAQAKLTLAMNVAVGTGKDLATATTLVSYAMGGNWGMVERYIPKLKEVQDEQEKWRLLNELFADQATEFGGTMAGQFKTLENNVSDLKEAFGEALLPTVQALLEPVKKFVSLMKEHPELTKMAAAATAVGAAVLGVSGAAMLASNTIKAHFYPQLVKMATFIWTKLIPALTAKISLLLASMAAMGPAGWAMLGTALATIGTLAYFAPELLKRMTQPKQTMDIGGMVTGGAPGEAVPVMARVGEYFSGYPPRGNMPSGMEIHFHVGAMMGNEAEAREFADLIFEYGRRSNRLTVGRTA